MAVAYFLVSFAPVWWPALWAFRRRRSWPRPFLFVGIVAALVYGVFSFLGFAILLPMEAYGIFIAPQLEAADIVHGAWLVGISRFFANYWWLLIPPAQFAMTWIITRQVGRRWEHICAAPPDEPTGPNPLRDATGLGRDFA
ncbi:MAG: hypothetical protein QM795_02770 [Pseudoxanthomonas sp.]